MCCARDVAAGRQFAAFWTSPPSPCPCGQCSRSVLPICAPSVGGWVPVPPSIPLVRTALNRRALVQRGLPAFKERPPPGSTFADP